MRTLLFFIVSSSVLLGGIFMASCEQPETQTIGKKEVSLGGIVLSYDGIMLSLATEEDATALHDYLATHPGEHKVVGQMFPTFVSSFTAFSELTDEALAREDEKIMASNTTIACKIEKGGEYYWEPVVDDPVWQYLTNKDGAIEVGGMVYKFYRDYVVVIPEADYLQSIDRVWEQDSSFRKILINRTIVSSEKGNIDSCDGEYTYDNKRYKVNGEIEHRDGLTSDALKNGWLRTKSHVRRLGVWWRVEADFISHTGNTCFYRNTSPGATTTLFTTPGIVTTDTNKREISTWIYATYRGAREGFCYDFSGGCSDNTTITHTARKGGITGTCPTNPPNSCF